MIRVQFENVGRDKMNWVENIPSMSEEYILQAVNRKRALASKEIAVGFTKMGGSLIVGFHRQVGTFRVVVDAGHPIQEYRGL